VQAAKIGSAQDIPHVSKDLIRKHLADLKGLELV
jgi:hypothetical protein